MGDPVKNINPNEIEQVNSSEVIDILKKTHERVSSLVDFKSETNLVMFYLNNILCLLGLNKATSEIASKMVERLREIRAANNEDGEGVQGNKAA